jgi:type IV pilus modification protein PilV
MMIRNMRRGSRSSGFSLIEVMIAVVVLATGLLALAALQGSLTRASAEAKVRGRVAAVLTARMDELRMQAATLADGSPTPLTSTTDPCDDGDATDWLDCTRAEANLGSFTVGQVVQSWSGETTFTQVATSDPNVPQFKRITLTATWESADGSDHTLTSTTDVSPYSLVTALIPPPSDSASGGQNPIVRQDSPVTAGMIPIALGNNQSSAASNPTPEVVGRNNNQTIVGTRFNVLTYVSETTRNAALIQRRFENDIIKCTCQYGAGGNNLPTIYRTAQWPAVWTGERYELAEDAGQVVAPGQSKASGPKSGVAQSPLCQECCRDHHDNSASTEVKFDPERSDNAVSKYNPNGAGILTVVPDTSSATYVNSCRVIRVDGFWRTASDMYSRQFGLLETEPVGLVKAKTGVPTAAATTAYTTYVKDYANTFNNSTVLTTGVAPSGSQAMYDDNARGLNAPTVLIAAANNSDYRYVHGRGLYFDHLEQKARKKIADVLADNDPATGRCPSTLTDKSECILPYLPFATINLTEIAEWVASAPSVLTINSGNLLSTTPAQPSGGRTTGRATGTANNNGTVRISNSGVAASSVILAGVDPTDQSTKGTDSQTFQVGGILNLGDSFDVTVNGGGLNPFLFYSIIKIPLDSGECFKPAGSSYRCGTNTTLGGLLGGSVTIQNYNVWETVSTSFTKAQLDAVCSGDTPGNTPATANLAVPTFTNYQVTSASINGTAATSLDVVREGKRIPDNTQTTGYRYEATTANFAAIPASAQVLFTLAAQGTSTATLQSCVISQPNGNNKPWTVSNVVWNEPWAAP